MMAVLAACSCGSETEETAVSAVEVESVDTLNLFVDQLRSCSRLYTAEATLHKMIIKDDPIVVEGEVFGEKFQVDVPLGKRKIAIPLTGTVKAYIDFSDFSRKNVTIDGDDIIVELPDPKIVLTATEIDHDNVREDVSFFRRDFSDKELTDYAKQGRDEIIKNVSNSGLLTKAELGAAAVIVPILRELGYKDEKIQVKFNRNVTSDPISFFNRNMEKNK